MESWPANVQINDSLEGAAVVIRGDTVVSIVRPVFVMVVYVVLIVYPTPANSRESVVKVMVPVLAIVRKSIRLFTDTEIGPKEAVEVISAFVVSPSKVQVPGKGFGP